MPLRQRSTPELRQPGRIGAMYLRRSPDRANRIAGPVRHLARAMLGSASHSRVRGYRVSHPKFRNLSKQMVEKAAAFAAELAMAVRIYGTDTTIVSTVVPPDPVAVIVALM